MASPDSVSFNGVLKSYPPGEKLEVSYCLQDTVTSASRDWVGLFQVGWSSSRDYYTFEWAPTPNEDRKGTVIFAGRRLPPEDKHFYQVCYVSSDGRVRGASSPFQFTLSASADHVEDLELVEVSEDSLMIVQQKEVIQSEPGPSVLEEELVSIKESFTKLVVEKELLVSKHQEDSAVKSEGLEKMEALVGDLQRQLQAKRDSESRLMEKLEKERALTHELTAAKTSEESQVQLLRQQMSELEATITALQEDKDRAGAVLSAREEDNHKLKAAVAALKEEGEKMVAKVQGLETVVRDLEQRNDGLLAREPVLQAAQENSEARVAEVMVQCEKYNEERDQVLQELAVAQQNIAELLGAQTEVCVPLGQEPPTLPASHVAMVDRSAYEALQQAYDNIEQMYYTSFEENRELRTRLHERKAKHDEAKRSVAELTHRVECCRIEYEAKCKELHQKQATVGATAGASFVTEVATLQMKLREMEDNQEQVTRSLDAAVQELASRREEVKQKSVQVAEAQEKVFNLEEGLRLIQEDYREFQDKHDDVVNTKRSTMDKQEDTIRAQVSEIAELQKNASTLDKANHKLEATVGQLREQLETLKRQAKTPERACPVCQTKFPGRISHQDFEKHVQGHFQGV